MRVGRFEESVGGFVAARTYNLCCLLSCLRIVLQGLPFDILVCCHPRTLAFLDSEGDVPNFSVKNVCGDAIKRQEKQER